MNSDVTHIRTAAIILCYIFLLILIFKKEQDRKHNWAMFFSTLWVGTSLLVVNWIAVGYDMWQFTGTKGNSLLPWRIPMDLFFVWTILWGTVLCYFHKGTHIIIYAFGMLWLDLLLMPVMQDYEIVSLNKYWWIAEVILLAIVYIPAHLWTKWYLNDENLVARASLQTIVISILLVIIIPFCYHTFTSGLIDIGSRIGFFWLQILFIVTLPGLVAVVDLVEKGHGTPFPFDPTKNLVRNSIYAYISNPIQWSLAAVFIPLSIIHQSIFILVGLPIAFAYSYAISEPHESKELGSKFGETWYNYKQNVPAWYFQFKPKHISQANIYFQKDCNQCNGVRQWLAKRMPINLNSEDAKNYEGPRLHQLRYVDEYGNHSDSVLAVADALQHINLIYASLGWFMKMPGVRHVLQVIVDSMGIFKYQYN